jgi:hypothetical protein
MGASSTYAPARSRRWLKIKIKHEEEFVIVGYTNSGGVRLHFGAIVVGGCRDGTLLNAGHSGEVLPGRAWRIWAIVSTRICGQPNAKGSRFGAEHDDREAGLAPLRRFARPSFQMRGSSSLPLTAAPRKA